MLISGVWLISQLWTHFIAVMSTHTNHYLGKGDKISFTWQLLLLTSMLQNRMYFIMVIDYTAMLIVSNHSIVFNMLTNGLINYAVCSNIFPDVKVRLSDNQSWLILFFFSFSICPSSIFLCSSPEILRDN